jgi:hypothetical protein
MDVDVTFNAFKCPNLTVCNVLDELQKTFDQFKEDRETQYISDIENDVKNGVVDPSEMDIDEQANKIGEKIKTDLTSFANDYLNKLIDKTLDSINEGTMEKKFADGLFILLTTAKKSFEND